MYCSKEVFSDQFLQVGLEVWKVPIDKSLQNSNIIQTIQEKKLSKQIEVEKMRETELEFQQQALNFGSLRQNNQQFSKSRELKMMETERKDAAVGQRVLREEGKEGLESETQTMNIPFSHLIHNPTKDVKKVVELCKSVYDAVFFVTNLSPKLKTMIEERISAKTFLLKGSNNKNKLKKTLFMDLDETLIHSSFTESEGFDSQIEIGDRAVWFNVRPHAFEFLKNMSALYEVVLFTTAEKSYAEAFFEYLNLRCEGALEAVLSRENCIHIYRGLYIKDLRTVVNRNIKDVVLLDNSAYCFGSQLGNGIPISSFLKDRSDLELLYIEDYLTRLSFAEDVRDFNRKELRLSEILAVTRLTDS